MADRKDRQKEGQQSIRVSMSILLPTNRQVKRGEGNEEKTVDLPKSEGVSDVEPARTGRGEGETRVFGEIMKKVQKPKMSVGEKPGKNYVPTSILLLTDEAIEHILAPTRAVSQIRTKQEGDDSNQATKITIVKTRAQVGDDLMSFNVAPRSAMLSLSNQREQEIEMLSQSVPTTKQSRGEMEPRSALNRSLVANKRFNNTSQVSHSSVTNQAASRQGPKPTAGHRYVK